MIFDLDGTLTRPYLDFDVMRREIGVEGPILESLASLDPASREQAEAILLRYERQAADESTLQDGAVEVVEVCRQLGYPVAILTRNARPTVEIVLAKHGFSVDALRTREDGAVKPSGEQLLSLCCELNADPCHSWMVGDYLFDILSGREAGTKTVLMIGDKPTPDYADQADHVIRRLADLLEFLPIG